MSEAGPSGSRPLKRSRSSATSKTSRVDAVAENAHTGSASADVGFGDKAEDEDEDVVTVVDDDAESSNAAAIAKERRAKKARKAKADASTPGVIYISRLPPGMTPQKVRHLMAKWGDVGKVYAQRRDAPTGYNPNSSTQKKSKHQRADFTEAWVEFLSKSVAKMVAQMLNAQMIGGKKGDKWRDDIWTMRYLSGFKWEMLGEQIAYERQSHQARLRNEISRSKTEQGEYLRNVELARVLEKRKQKRIAAGGDGSVPEKTGKEASSSKEGDDGRKQGYRQRQAEDGTRGMKEVGMASVLGNVFG